ncbi:MAG: FAD binding domain-containing protein [Pseudomonadota bacterium]
MLSVETFSTLSAAAGAMSGRARYLAGGTLVMRDVNYGAHGIDRILRTTDSDLRQIRSEGPRIRIGAGATMSDIIASPDLGALAPAARAIGGPAIRNMATVGGNLFAPHPYGDFATALLALDAEVQWTDGRSELLESFLTRRDSATGLVAAVSIPRISAGEFRFAKVSRTRPKGVSVMSIAAWLPGGPSRLGDPRIAFGAMGPTPLRAKATEAALAGASLDENGIARALEVCTEGLAPVDDPLASAWYRNAVASVHLKRLLLQERRV